MRKSTIVKYRTSSSSQIVKVRTFGNFPLTAEVEFVPDWNLKLNFNFQLKRQGDATRTKTSKLDRLTIYGKLDRFTINGKLDRFITNGKLDHFIINGKLDCFMINGKIDHLIVN